MFLYIPKTKDLQIKSLDDPILRRLKIGVHLLGDDYDNPPPVHELAKRGIVDNVVGLRHLLLPRESAQQDHRCCRQRCRSMWRLSGDLPQDILSSDKPVPLELVPVPSGKGDLPFAFDISMGVRQGDEELKTQLEKVLDRKQAEIRKILEDYGVPLMDGKVDAK